MAHAPGTSFGQYEIRSLLGKGGMSEVYLAYDMRHRREVALKLLPLEFANDEERLRRFAQEAFATTTLASDHFINIYEIGQADSFPFLAMEFIEGVTLRQHLRASRMTVGESLGVAVQLAEALRVAHESGIVHRDIKPENIMLRGDGRIKVLDLGLAKLTEAFHHRISTPDALTVTNISTGHGVVLGTVNYMSPEQLRGLPVDERTDIWSLGVVLYEMLSGESPFKGRAPEEVAVSILEREPPLLTHLWPGMPGELCGIIDALLQKDRERRYQTARQVLCDLEDLGRDSMVELSDLLLSAPRTGTGRTTDGPAAVETAPNAEPTPLESGSALTEGSARLMPVAFELSRHKLNVLVLTLLLTAAGGAGYLAYRAFVGSRTAAQRSMRFARLEMPGDAREAALSPDGKYVVAILEDTGQQSLVMREAATSSLTRIVGPTGRQYMGLTFSPDGRYVYYLEKAQETGTLFRVPKVGGAPEKLLDRVNTPVTFAPGGERIAFVRYEVGEQTTVLMTARADGTDERVVVKRAPPAGFTLGGFRSSGPAWSPDGKVIACPTFNMYNTMSADVVAVHLDDGTQRRVNASGWASIERIAWLEDGSGLLMNAADAAESPYQLWLLSYASGEAHRITNDPNSYGSVSASSDSNSLVTVKSDQLSTVWLLPDGDMGSARQIPNTKYKGSNGISWTPAGELVYTSNEGDVQSVWRMRADGLEPMRLTSGVGASVQPAASADGRYLAFVSYHEGLPHIWRADADGAHPKQLTHGLYEDTPQFTPDGRWVVYHSIYPDRDSVWRVSVDGGAPELLSAVLSLHPVVSPDGKTIASFSRDEQPTAPWKIALMHAEGGAPFKWFDLPATVDVAWPALRWEPDGRALTYIATVNGVSDIWRQDLSGGPPAKLTDFKEEQIFSFAWSDDGKQLACVRGQQTSDVIMISGFR